MQIYKTVLLYGISSLVILILVWNGIYSIDGRAIGEGSDANYYIRGAHHLYHNHTFSGDNQDKNPKPSAYREPGYSAYLALAIALSPKLKKMDIAVIRQEGTGLELLRYAQLPILIGMSLLAMCIVYGITRKFIYACLAMLMIGCSSILFYSMIIFKVEHFTVFLVLLVALFFYRAILKKNILNFILLACSLGILVLTKAIYMYFIVIVIITILLLARAGYFNRRQLIISLMSLALPYTAIVGGWMIRNYIHFNRFYITDRAGDVMAIRVEYNKMNTTEYFGSFLFWTQDSYAQRKLVEIYGENAVQSGGPLARLHRSNPNGYYKIGKSLKNIAIKGGGSVPQQDKKRQRKCLKEFLAHPFKHLLVTIPIAWRGIFIEDGWVLSAPASVSIRSTLLVSLVYVVSLITMVVLTIKKRKWELFVITLPALYLFSMNSFLTHGLPRYNIPASGIAVISLFLVVHFFKNKRSFTVNAERNIDKPPVTHEGPNLKARRSRK